MPLFEFSMIHHGIEHVKKMEIPQSELEPRSYMSEKWNAAYRKNVIEKHMNKWALSQLTLSYEEVESHSRDKV